MAKHEPPTQYELEVWRNEACRKVVCTGCYGSGQRHRYEKATDSERWELCDRCQGSARCDAEPHVIRLVDEVRRLNITLSRSEAALKATEETWFECHDGSEQGCCKAHED